MDFKEWLATEGFMRLPYSSYKNIVDFYAETKTQYELKPRVNIPERILPLDLQGTRWEFLQYLNPKVAVKIRNAVMVDNNIGYYAGMSGSTGRIVLAAKSGMSITSTIEHELLHFLQDLIGFHAKQRILAKSDRRSEKPKTSLGGLPNKKIMVDLLSKYDVRGHVRGDGGGTSWRRTTHRHRPIEQMTNLNSLINDMRMTHLERTLRNLNINPSNTTWQELLGNREFMVKLSDGKEKAKMVRKKEFEDLHPESVRFYQREIFKNFVDSTDWSDTFELLRIQSGVREKQKEIRRQKEQQTEKKTKELDIDLKGYKAEDFGKGVKVKIDFYDVSDFSNLDEFLGPDYEEHEDYEDPRESAESMFDALGINGNKDGDRQFLATAEKLKKIFDSIKQLKQAEPEKLKRCNWDFFARKLASYAVDKLESFMYKNSKKLISEKEFLSIFYPDPIEECPSGEEA